MYLREISRNSEFDNLKQWSADDCDGNEPEVIVLREFICSFWIFSAESMIYYNTYSHTIALSIMHSSATVSSSVSYFKWAEICKKCIDS